VNWTGTATSTTNPRTDTGVTADITVTANFAINTYTLTYTAGVNGSITGGSPQTVAYGTSGSAVAAVPNTGYHFVQWSDLSVANPRTDAGVTSNINVTASFALGQGNVTDDGGSVITKRGIVWNTGGSPTTSDSKTTVAGTTGSFTATITGLTAGTIYHVRAYATNAMGTSYGSELTFITLEMVPTVATATGVGNALVATNAGTIINLAAVTEGSLPTKGKPNIAFPFGFFSFEIMGLNPGQTVAVTITLPSTIPIGTQYWQYQASGGGWFQIPIGDDDGDNVINITLTVGYAGDSNPAPGIIGDPGGLGVRPPAVPGLSQWGIMALVLLFGSSMVWIIRRKQIRSETNGLTFENRGKITL
jgi:hypothetical protein